MSLLVDVMAKARCKKKKEKAPRASSCLRLLRLLLQENHPCTHPSEETKPAIKQLVHMDEKLHMDEILTSFLFHISLVNI
jgi:hypothetical protein